MCIVQVPVPILIGFLPPGSGSVSLHTDPDPTVIIQIQIHGSGDP